jgi:hypothetical protein
MASPVLAAFNTSCRAEMQSSPGGYATTCAERIVRRGFKFSIVPKSAHRRLGTLVSLPFLESCKVKHRFRQDTTPDGGRRDVCANHTWELYSFSPVLERRAPPNLASKAERTPDSTTSLFLPNGTRARFHLLVCRRDCEQLGHWVAVSRASTYGEEVL